MTCSAKASRRAQRTAGMVLLAWLLAGGWAMPADAKKKKKAKKLPSAEELFNPLLGVDWSHWLVGPISHMTTEAERAAYLAIGSDADAERFVDDFWAVRNEDTPVFQDTPEKTFGLRVAEADKRFSEAAFPGSRTDRGTIFVVYGEPSAVSFPTPDAVDAPTPEVWTYGEDAKPGLNGAPPEKEYRFVKLGDLTVFYKASMRRDPRLVDPHQRLRRNRPRD